MRFIIFVLAALFATLPAFCLDLTEAVIVLGQDADPAEETAASELSLYLGKITGREYPVTAAPPEEGPAIYVGQTGLVKSLLPDFDWDSLKDDGTLMKSGKDRLILAGDRPRGSIYAVYGFLEDCLGCRFLTAHVETVPKRDRITVKDDLYKTYVPPFTYREPFMCMNYINQQTTAKLRVNGDNWAIERKWGGNRSMMRVGHAFESELLPGSKYFKEHPEWFALRDGVRRPVQPCLSDPEALKEVAANIRREIEELGIRHVAVGLNDNNLYCQCPDCEALAEKYGAQSGVLIHALNHIYDLIKDEYPDVMLETFAYLHTAEPPKGIRPCDHVMIVLCDIENNFGASFTEASSRPLLLPENARYFLYADQQTVNGEYYRRLREWGKITDNLFIWHYVVNFSNYLILHPNLAPFKKDLQAFRDAGAKALFLQGDRHNAYAGFTALRNYLLCRLAWDPDSDEDELMKDFMKGFYGAGWEYIYRIWKYAGEIVEKRNIFISTYCYDDSWLTKEEMAEIFRLFSLALSAASDDKDARYRIYYDLMCFQVAWYLADDETRDYCAKSGWMGITDPERFARYFLNFARNNGIVEFSEGGPIENSILSGYRPKEKSGSVPSVCEGLAEDEWIELLPDDFAIIQKGALADVLEDPEAVTGRACVLYSATVEWNMASGLSKLLFYLSDRGYRTCDVYVSAKRAGEMADPEADALQVITWEPGYGLEKTFKARELGEGYSLLSAGSFEIKRRPNADMFLYPLNKPEGCREVWIDRVILIPRK